MKNPENSRLLAEDRTLQEAEAALRRDEQALWSRLDALDADDLDARAQAAIGRIEALAAAGRSTPDLTRASAVLDAVRATAAPLAPTARLSALAARKSALQARDVAAGALASALARVEPTRQAVHRDIDAIDGYVGKLEVRVKEAIERRRQSPPAGTVRH